MSYDKIKFFDGMRGIAEKLKTMILKRTDKGKDENDRPFKKYSKSYSELIDDKFQKKDGSRLKSVKGFPIGDKKHKPNLRLRGLTMNNLAVRKVTKEGFSLGWKGEAAEIIQGNQDNGRDPVGLTSKELTWLEKQLGKKIDVEIDKIPNTITIKAR